MPVWSRDGSQIAFQRAEGGKSFTLHVANADGSGERLLPDGVSGTFDWAPDGRALLVTDGGRIYVTNEDWTERSLLFDGGRPGDRAALVAGRRPDRVRARGRERARRRLRDERGRHAAAGA